MGTIALPFVKYCVSFRKPDTAPRNINFPEVLGNSPKMGTSPGTISQVACSDPSPIDMNKFSYKGRPLSTVRKTGRLQKPGDSQIRTRPESITIILVFASLVCLRT